MQKPALAKEDLLAGWTLAPVPRTVAQAARMVYGQCSFARFAIPRSG